MEKMPVNKVLLRKMFILFFAIVGFLTTIKLAIIYYEANFNEYALPSFCSINNFIDCDGVAQTTHSQFLGIPLALWGIFLYLFIIFLVFVDKLKNIKLLSFLEVFKNQLAYISAVGLISFFISMSLAAVSIFEIKKICILCVFTYILNLLIAIAAKETTWLNDFIVSAKDFIDAIKVKKYLISFLGVAFLAFCVLSYTTISCVLTPQIKRIREFRQYEKMQDGNPFKATGNVLGDKNAKLTVYIYTDYRCPICRTYNVITHRAAKELGGFKMVHKNLPLDMECNEKLSKPFHEGSCMMAKYAIAAENQGKFWDFNSDLFETQPKTESDVLALASVMGFNTAKMKKDANSETTKERLRNDIDNAINLNIDGTPTIVINGKVYAGIKPYYELKDILLKAGAYERKQ